MKYVTNIVVFFLIALSLRANLITNGSFDYWNGAYPVGWSVYNYSQSFGRSQTLSKEGSSLFLLANPAPANTAYGVPAVTQAFTTSPGHQSINLRLEYCSPSSGAIRVRIRHAGNRETVRYYNGSTWENSIHVDTQARSGWYGGDKGVGGASYSFRLQGDSVWKRVMVSIPSDGSHNAYAIDLIGEVDPTQTDQQTCIDDLVITSTPTQRKVIMQGVSWFSPDTARSDSDGYGAIWDKCTLPDSYAEHVEAIEAMGVDVLTISSSVRSDPSLVNPINHTGTIEKWLAAANASTGATPLKVSVCIDNFPAQTTAKAAHAVRGILSKWSENDAYWKENGKPVISSFGLNSQNASTPDPAYPTLTPAYWDAVKANLDESGHTNYTFIGDCYENPYRAAPGNAGGVASCAVDGLDGASIQAMADCTLFTEGLSVAAINHNLAWMQQAWPMSQQHDSMQGICQETSIRWTPSVSPGYYRRGNAFISPRFAYMDWLWSYARSVAGERPTLGNWVILYTWNDIDEDTTVWPGLLKGRALYDLQSFYVEWYKMGEPPPARDQVFINYPTTTSTRTTTWGGENSGFPAHWWGNFQASPTVLELRNDSGTVLYSVTVNGTGVQYGVFPNGNAYLTQISTAVVSRNGQAISSASIPPAQEASATENLRHRWVSLSPYSGAEWTTIER